MRFLCLSILIGSLFIGSNSHAQNFNLFYEVESGLSHNNFYHTNSRNKENKIESKNLYKDDSYRLFYSPNFKLNVGLSGMRIFKQPFSIKTSIEKFSYSYGFKHNRSDSMWTPVDNQIIENFYLAGIGIESPFSIGKNWESIFGMFCTYTFKRDGYYNDYLNDIEGPTPFEWYELHEIPYRKILLFVDCGIFYKKLNNFIQPGIRLRTTAINLNPKEPEKGGWQRGYLSSINLVLKLGDFR